MIDAANIIIDPAFQSRIPPLSVLERTSLEMNLCDFGCRDPLVIWKGYSTLLDGHNRREICQNYGIPFTTVEIELNDREAAEDWIDRNQLGRRNLPPDQMALLRGRVYNRAKAKQGGDHGNQHTAKDQSDPLPTTAQKLAEEFGVGEATIKRDGQYASAVEKIQAVAPELTAEIQSGEHSRAAVVEAAKSAEPEAVKAALASPRRSRFKRENQEPTVDEPSTSGPRKGLELAHEAINALRKISPNDQFRARGLQIVGDWIGQSINRTESEKPPLTMFEGKIWRNTDSNPMGPHPNEA